MYNPGLLCRAARYPIFNQMEMTSSSLPATAQTLKEGTPRRVLIIGAGGFAGGFIVDEALRRGLEVWAGVRESTSRKYLSDPRIRFLNFEFDDPEQVSRTLADALPAGERWDWIVYNLGATKCLRFSDFSRINYQYLRTFTEALEKTGLIPDKFIYMSSLSAIGPGDEKNYTPLTESMIPGPDTRYGASKLKSEMWLAMSGIPYIILRPTGIYGPRDHDYFLMFKSIAKGWDFSVGFRRQMLTFLYVEDLARAVFDALEKAPVRETYNLAHPSVWTQSEFRRLVSKKIDKHIVIPMRMPIFAVRMACRVSEFIGAATGKPSTLNSDKFHILRQRNWSVDISKGIKDFGFSPQVDLPEGISRSVEWYRKEGWL